MPDRSTRIRRFRRNKRIHRRFKISGHAREQCIARGIQEKDVLNILKAPVQTVYDQYTERYKSYGTAIDEYTKKSQHIMVIHTDLKGKSSVTVITVMWIDKSGLRQYGFNNI